MFFSIMSSAAATAAVATEILAAQKLYYNSTPNPGAAIFLVISSQMLGYGIAGLLRNVLGKCSNIHDSDIFADSRFLKKFTRHVWSGQSISQSTPS